MNAPVIFAGKRSQTWMFGAGLGVVLFAGLCIVIPFTAAFAWGLELLCGGFLAACAAWLAYLLLAPTMSLTISPEAVICTSRLTPIRIDRSAGDGLTFESVYVNSGRSMVGVTYWKMCPSGSPRGLLLTQWDPASVAEACRSNGWQVEWRERGDQVLPGKG